MTSTLIFLAIVITFPASANTVADFEKTCLSLKKKASLCGCLTRNLKHKVDTKEIGEDQLPVALQALKGETPPADSNSTYYDNLADFLAGLEPHCLKNSKYNSSQP